MWLAFLSHKVLRWLAPFLLLTLMILNLLLYSVAGYRWLLIAQSVFYILAVLGFLKESLRRTYLIYLPYYFVVVNAAAFHGFFRFLAIKEHALWEKVDR
jgi:poly-beta-1,6-N-acetyl-D-glucosamine synthase